MESGTEIQILLNSAGYDGNDVQELLPDFITDRYTVVGLTWYPSVDGPESFTVVITTGILLAEFAKEYVKNLSKDLYEWSKTKLFPLLSRKNFPKGVIILRLRDAEIYYDDNSDFKSAETDFSIFLTELPSLVSEIDVDEGKEWFISYDSSKKLWSVKSEKNLHDSNKSF